MSTLRAFLDASKTTQAAFARALGKQQSYVSMLLHRVEKGRPFPADICPNIEKATGGKITRHDLRPDLFGPAPKSKKRARAA